MPEPTPEEREAILAALAGAEPADAPGSAWRRAALDPCQEEEG